MKIARVAGLTFAFTLAAIVATATRAGGQAPTYPPYPPSVPLYDGRGLWCHATPMRDGAWSGGHCLFRGVRLADGSTPRWSRDRVRDLGHISALANESLVYRTPNTGESVSWTNERMAGGGYIAFVGAAWIDKVGNRIEISDRIGAPGWPAVLACHSTGDRIARGDSGTGIVATIDSALVGIVVAATVKEGGERGRCAPAAAVIGVIVP